jgi:hypothetical protein
MTTPYCTDWQGIVAIGRGLIRGASTATECVMRDWHFALFIVAYIVAFLSCLLLVQLAVTGVIILIARGVRRLKERKTLG